MVLHRPDAFLERLGADGLIGFGESYMAGDWDADPTSARCSTVFAARMATLVPEPLQKLRAALRRPGRRAPSGTRRQHAHNISRHYDLSNDAVRAVPRRDDELLLGAVRRRRTPRRAGRRCRPRSRRQAPQDRAAARPGRRRRGHPGPRDRHRLGRAGDPGRPARRDRPLGDPVAGAAGAGPRAHRRGRRRRPGRRRAAATTARSADSTTRSSRSR